MPLFLECFALLTESELLNREKINPSSSLLPLDVALNRSFHPARLFSMIFFAQSLNTALNLATSGRWTLRDKAAQRRLALR